MTAEGEEQHSRHTTGTCIRVEHHLQKHLRSAATAFSLLLAPTRLPLLLTQVVISAAKDSNCGTWKAAASAAAQPS